MTILGHPKISMGLDLKGASPIPCGNVLMIEEEDETVEKVEAFLRQKTTVTRKS